MQSENNDDDAGDPAQFAAVLARQFADGGGGSAKNDEHDAEAENEEDGIQHDAAEQALLLVVFGDDGTRTRDEGHISGNQRQYAWREKRKDPGGKYRDGCKVGSGHWLYSSNSDETLAVAKG